MALIVLEAIIFEPNEIVYGSLVLCDILQDNREHYVKNNNVSLGEYSLHMENNTYIMS